MKHLLLFFCLLLALKTAYAQDTLYYYENGCLAPTAEGAHTKKITTKENLNDSSATVLEFHISGANKSETYYSNYANRTKSKQYKQWYENGQINIIANYFNNKLNGEVLTYWKDGTPKREDIYDNNVLINGKCWDKDGNEIPHFAYLITPKRTFNINEYVIKHLRYPDECKANAIIGCVRTIFTITKEGTFCNFEVASNTAKELNDESLRVLKGMQKWEPAICDGEIISYDFNYPINFEVRK